MARLETDADRVVGLISLISSYDHVNLPQRQLPLQQQWRIWLISLSLAFTLFYRCLTGDTIPAERYG